MLEEEGEQKLLYTYWGTGACIGVDSLEYLMHIREFFVNILLVFVKERQNGVAFLLYIKGTEGTGKSYRATVPSPHTL